MRTGPLWHGGASRRDARSFERALELKKRRTAQDGFRVLAFLLDAYAGNWRSVVPVNALGASVTSRFNYYQDKPIRLPAPGNGTVVHAQYVACAWLSSPLLATALPVLGMGVFVVLSAANVVAVFATRVLLAALALAPQDAGREEEEDGKDA